MSIRSIELIHVALLLKSKIKHASHERSSSDSLIVRATLDSGEVGHGEGVPRAYVTGETIETAFAALRAFDSPRAVGSPANYHDAVRAVTGLQLPEIEADPRGMFGNAARCALEMALLDAFGRKFDRSFGDAVRLQGESGLGFFREPMPVRYSGAITADSTRKERISAFKMRIYGFDQVKVKVGVEGQDDASRLATIRRIIGSSMDMRIDANEAWHASELIGRVRPLLFFHPSALEQPVPHAEVGALADLRLGLGVPIMLDESLCGYPDGLRAVADGTADVFNVRISKCGGIGPTMRLMALAGRSGLDVQLGCHPGETGLLSAAGRHVASNVAGIWFVEGSYDRHVLETNVIVEDITFGYGGRAKPLSGPGLGVTVDREALERMTVAREEVSLG